MTSGYRADAEGCSKLLREILEQRKAFWFHILPPGSREEADYVEWLARWAFHWARKVTT